MRVDRPRRPIHGLEQIINYRSVLTMVFLLLDGPNNMVAAAFMAPLCFSHALKFAVLAKRQF